MQRSEARCLWIVRHGRAEPTSASGLDADRRLDARGLEQAEWLGHRMARHDHRPEAIIASPAERTWTTASRIADIVGLDPVRCARLTCDQGVSEALDSLTQIAPRVEIGFAVVGHNPTVSELLAWLCDGFGRPGVHLRTGEAAVVMLPTREALREPGRAEAVDFFRRG